MVAIRFKMPYGANEFNLIPGDIQFFFQFAKRRVHRASIFCAPVPAGKCDLVAPRIPFVVGFLDGEQAGFGFLKQKKKDTCRPIRIFRGGPGKGSVADDIFQKKRVYFYFPSANFSRDIFL